MSVYTSSAAVTAQQHQQQQRQQHQQRLGELLEGVKLEFDLALNEVTNFKQVREDFDIKCSQQIAEMQQIKQTVYELEVAHRKIKEAYEEEILRLKTELENRDRQAQAQQKQKLNGVENKTPVLFGAYSQVPQPQKPQLMPPVPPAQSLPGAFPPKEEPRSYSPGMVKPEMAKPLEVKSSGVPVAPQAKQTVPPEQASSLMVIDSNQYVVSPAQRASHTKEIPPFLADLDASKNNSEFKKQRPEYYVLYNPAFKRELDIDLIHSLDHFSVVCCVRFSKSGEYIATGSNKTTQVFNVKTGELIAKLTDENSSGADDVGEGGQRNEGVASVSSNSSGDLYIRSLCFSPDDRLLATGAEDKLIRIWDLASKKIVKVLKGHEQDIYSLDFFPEGNRLVSGSGDKTVRIWDLNYSQCSLTLSIEETVTTVAVSPDGLSIAAGSLDTTVRVWDASTGFLIESLDSGSEDGNGHEQSVYSVAFSSDGKKIASGSLDRTVKLWNLEGKNDPLVSGQSFSGSKKPACEVTYVGHKDFVLSVCLTSNSGYTLSGSKDRGVIFWDKNSGNALLMLQGHGNSVISVAVTSNAEGTEGIFATGSGDCKARLWRWYKT